MKFDRESIVRRSEAQVSCEIGQEVVALSVSKGNYFQMDEVGGQIWKRLESPLSVGELCDRLQSEYEVNAEQCELETLAFLQSLSEAGLVEHGEQVD